MALGRKDSPLSNTPDPGKGNITRTQITNPNGSITYKMNWNASSSSPARTSSSPVKRSNASTSRSVSAPAKNASMRGSREITTIVPESRPEIKPRIGGIIELSRLTNKVETPSIEKRREEMRVKTYDKWKKEGESRSDYDTRIKAATEQNAAKNKDESFDSSGGSGLGPKGCGCK